jgi:cell division topological specificity factor
MMDFFKTWFKRESSSATAKERLRLVLLSDHLSLAPDVVENLRRDLIAVISRYVEVDEAHCDVSFEQQDSAVAMLANIPILKMKEPPRGGGAPKPAAPPPPAPVVPQPTLEPHGIHAAAEPAELVGAGVAPPDEASAVVVPNAAVSADVDQEPTSAPAPKKRRRRRRSHAVASTASPALQGYASPATG